MKLDSMYQDVILDHYKNPHGRGLRDGDAEHGRAIGTQPFPFRAYNWGSLWSELRRRVPETATYRAGAKVEAVEQDADGVTVRLADGEPERFDLVIG
ncbi:hypothetical protein ADL35_18340, partial [Streptomyces sp. NRRL WC-3753]